MTRVWSVVEKIEDISFGRSGASSSSLVDVVTSDVTMSIMGSISCRLLPILSFDSLIDITKEGFASGTESASWVDVCFDLTAFVATSHAGDTLAYDDQEKTAHKLLNDGPLLGMCSLSNRLELTVQLHFPISLISMYFSNISKILLILIIFIPLFLKRSSNSNL